MADQDFLKLSPTDQHSYLMDTDPDYKGLAPDDQRAYVQHITGSAKPNFAVNPPPAANAAPVNMQTEKISPVMKGFIPQDLPGAGEGAGLAGGLSEYDKAVAGGIGGGVKDIAQGNVSRGAHKVIGGVGNAMAPILPLTIPAAPVAALGTLGGGYGGGKLAEYGAQKAGATPDQVDLAGDVGNVVGGMAGGALGHIGQQAMPGPTRMRAKAGFQDVAKVTNPDIVDTAVPGNIALDIQKEAASGGSQPKVIRDFVNRLTDPKKGPLTFEEARRFYTNASRLSADEQQRLTPNMKRLVSQFAADLDSSLTKTAEGRGKGPQYQGAMKDYRRAAQGQDVIDNLKEYGKKAAIAGATGAGGYGLYKAITK